MGSSSTHTCTLPGGYFGPDGTVHREVALHQLTGREEEMLAAMHQASMPELVTSVLARCVKNIGDVTEITSAVAGALLVADRNYLLLQLRAQSFGDRITGTIACPWPQCGAKNDVDFRIADIPVVRRDWTTGVFEMQLSDAAVAQSGAEQLREVVFRLPNGSDQEALVGVFVENEALALTRLLSRCLVVRSEDVEAYVDQLSPLARKEIEDAMYAQAPHIELDMELQCIACNRPFTSPFDIHKFFFGELRTARDTLYRQVHYLAYHYHWGEKEVMEMPRDKRLAFIEILTEEIEALNEGYA